MCMPSAPIWSSRSRIHIAAVQSKTYRAINLAATGRYVKIEADGSTAWTTTNEAEVRGP